MGTNTVVSDDLQEIWAADEGWRHEYQHVGKTRFHGSLSMLQTESCQLSETVFDSEVIARGALPEETYCFAVLNAPEQRFRGKDVGDRDLVLLDHNQVFDFCHGGRLVAHLAVVPEVMVQEFFRLRLRSDSQTLAQQGVISLHDRSLKRDLSKLILDGLRQPERNVQAEEVLNLVLPHLSETEEPDRVPARRRAARKAYDILASEPESDRSISDLCRQTGATERTLYRGFRECYGLSIKEFVLGLRLDRAHELLRGGHVETVTNAALGCGMKHLGRFALAYKRRFGERPSETLSQS